MNRTLLVLSGPIASGKSRVADALVTTHQYERIRSSAYLRTLARERGFLADRSGLQNLGDLLDHETDYRWVADAAIQNFSDHPQHDRWLLDAARKQRQIDHLRQLMSPDDILHVHIWAPENVLRARYSARYSNEMRASEADGIDEFNRASAHPNEVAARELKTIADVVFDTSVDSTNNIVVGIFDALRGRNAKDSAD